MEHTYRPHEFAALIGKTVNTLQRWDREGILPAHRSPTNRRYYTHDQYLEYRGLKATGVGSTFAYARVASAGQKPDLQNQLAALRDYCQRHDVQVDEWIEEVGSGLNYQRKQFNRLMEEIELGRVHRLVIAHKDRLVRFGFECFAAFLPATWNGPGDCQWRYALARARVGARPAFHCAYILSTVVWAAFVQEGDSGCCFAKKFACR